jgi:hypothetical protein
LSYNSAASRGVQISLVLLSNSYYSKVLLRIVVTGAGGDSGGERRRRLAAARGDGLQLSWVGSTTGGSGFIVLAQATGSGDRDSHNDCWIGLQSMTSEAPTP